MIFNFILIHFLFHRLGAEGQGFTMAMAGLDGGR